MDRTWILVAHRGGARLFENKGPGKGLELLQTLDHPAGKLKNKDIDTDQPGRGTDRNGPGRHAYESAHSATTHVAEQFAKQLSTLLDDGRSNHRYGRLVLVAEPRFLGNLRAALNAQTAALVTGTLDKDLGGTDARELPRHLDGVVRI